MTVPHTNIGKRVVLVGTCPSSRLLAPFADPGVEIWVCGPDNVMVLPRVTRWFEIHGDLGLPGGDSWEPSYIRWLNDQAFDLIVSDKRTFPRGRLLPKDDLLDTFGRHWFTSTPAWMIAYAAINGVKEVGLYGLDMSARREYLQERPAMQHLIEVCERSFAMSVYAPLESDILQPPPLYGFDKSTPRGRKLEVRRRELVGRMADLDRQIEQAKHDRVYLEGALDDIDYQQTIWNGERDPELAAPERAGTTEEPKPKVVALKGD
jgi:hypothetical protein